MEILTQHELAIAKKGCEGGIQSAHPTFLPTHGEISNWMSRKSVEESKINYYAALPPPKKGNPEYKKWNLFVPNTVNGYEAVVELTKTADESEYKFVENYIHKDGRIDSGVWIPWQWWEEKVRGREGVK